MAINLVKGQRVEIDNTLTRLKIEMGWKVNPNAVIHTASIWRSEKGNLCLERLLSISIGIREAF